MLDPSEQALLLEYGCGITNLVARTTAAAAELGADELRRGVDALRAKVERHRPRVLAVLGIGAYRSGFAMKKATLGRQSLRLATTQVWVLPNPSGLNAHYQLPDLIRLFAQLRVTAGPAGTA